MGITMQSRKKRPEGDAFLPRFSLQSMPENRRTKLKEHRTFPVLS